MNTLERRAAMLQAAASLLAENVEMRKLSATNTKNLEKFSHWTKTLAVYLDQRLGEEWGKD